MRTKARCEHCGRELLFFQLYTAAPPDADRCPHCGRHLGVIGLRTVARTVDRSAAELVSALREIAARNPRFRLDAESILGPVRAAVAELADRPDATVLDLDRSPAATAA